MDGAKFAKMLSDKHLFELDRMEYKYSVSSVKEFIGLLRQNLAQPLPLADFSSDELFYLPNLAQISTNGMKQLLSVPASNQSFGLQAMTEEIHATFRIESIRSSRNSIRHILNGYAPRNEEESRIYGMKRGLDFIADRQNAINVEVILCGSLVHMMMEQTLSYSSPLYGRRTGQIRLKQIPYAYYDRFFPDLDEQTRILYYAVTGGVPKYIELFHPCADIDTAILQNVMTPQSFLYEEPEFLLRQEVQDVGSYFSIIRAIASGNMRISDIASALSLPATSLSKPLKTLCDLDILEREVPPTEKNIETSKKGQYRIKDNFLTFWFRFVYPMRSFIESDHPEIAMTKLKTGFIPNHVGYVYEDICRQKMWELNAQGKLPFLFDRVGRWWGGKDTEIDIVAIDTTDRSKIIFGECKFHQNVPMQLSELHQLKEKAAVVPWGNANRDEYFALFCISGYSEDLQQLAQEDSHLLLM